MSITDELRKYADTLSEHARCGETIPSPFNPHSGAPIGPTKETEELYAIADLIDAEHEKAIRELNNLADSCVLLPKDADGEYIHIGDELDGYGYPNGGAYCKAIVNEVMILAGPKDSSYRSWLMWDAAEVRHHHEPTVEDVLREFGEKYCDTVTDSDDEKTLFAEYAAKLQLRGDGE